MNHNNNSNFKILAHRGNGEHNTHNSLECFREAVKNLDLDGVEFDVRI